MPQVLFLFLDGVGLGEPDPNKNPFMAANLPALSGILDGRPLILETAPFESDRVSLLALDACLGTPGSPQSASGQAALLTGRNVPAEIGEHYGPKPNPAIIEILHEETIFSLIRDQGGRSALLNAYPPRYFEAIESGRRLYSSIPMAVAAAGIPLMTATDLQKGRAMSVDFTGEGWAAQPGFPPAPVYTSGEAAVLLSNLSSQYDLAWFDFWPSDYAGHKGSMEDAIELLERFDDLFGHLIEAWADRDALILLTSDHGNLEDLDVRGHTRNPVPALLIGPPELRRSFTSDLHNLTDVAPAIFRTIYPNGRESSSQENPMLDPDGLVSEGEATDEQ